ncbi:kelch-like protein 30 [Mya arenaria]|uniref:kelch-like protein 30 n=1 Tax=Mya arenaria TaxID=6604 RepID=UPI0022E31CE1|nr:kelch-like protein 30 [Mya arenaria]XP_052777291.1 kelch-like protein 30 [Mya arenaria]
MDQKAASSLVNLNVDGKLLTCPRDVLVRESDYFRAMFDSNMMESNTKSVTLHGQDYDTVVTLMDSMDTGDLRIDQDSAESLLTSAVMLQMKSAIDTCEGYFLTALDDSNCFELADLAKANILHRLYNEAKRHSLFYFQSVRKYPQFLELNAVPLKQYLSSCYLNCKTEIEIVDAINDWLNHDKGSRENKLGELLECVNHTDFTRKDWASLAQHTIVTDCLTARAWMKDKSSLGDLSLHMNRSRQVPVDIFCVRFMETSEAKRTAAEQVTQDIVVFDERHCCVKSVKLVEDIYGKDKRIFGFQATVVGKDLYLSGGQSDVLRGKFVNEVWKYDGFHGNWTVATEMALPRRHHAACGSDTELFILGGFGKFRVMLDSFQKYDTTSGEWTSLHNFPKSCYDSGMTYTSDRIFVTTPSVYVYTLRTNTWASVCEDKIASEWITTQITPLEYDGDLYLCPKDGFKLCSDCFNVDENEIYRSADGWSVFDLQKYETKLGIQSMTFFNQTYYSVTHDGVLWKGNLFSDRLTLKRLNKEHELIGHYKPIAVPSYPYFKISEDCSNTEDCKTF